MATAEMVRLTKSLRARLQTRALSELPRGTHYWLGPEMLFLVVARYDDKVDLRLMGGAGHGRPVEFGVLHVPAALVEETDWPKHSKHRICPSCGQQRQHACFRQGRAECSVCAWTRLQNRHARARGTPIRRQNKPPTR